MVIADGNLRSKQLRLYSHGARHNNEVALEWRTSFRLGKQGTSNVDVKVKSGER
jgi:hypothetical protein